MVSATADLRQVRGVQGEDEEGVLTHTPTNPRPKHNEADALLSLVYIASIVDGGLVAILYVTLTTPGTSASIRFERAIRVS